MLKVPRSSRSEGLSGLPVSLTGTTTSEGFCLSGSRYQSRTPLAFMPVERVNPCSGDGTGAHIEQ